jgi:tetratricopeptide (TPR) repeat protein
MKVVINIFMLVLSINAAVAAISLDQRRKKIISIIDRELGEVSRLSKNVKRRDPNLLLRMAELNLEKARLWKEKENENYLSLSVAKRRKTNKKFHFKVSGGFFTNSKKLCERILSRFKRFKHIADAYYILAYHYKEFGNIKKATKYFNLANRKSSRSSMTKTKSQVALAELYYNKANYRKAIPLYEKSLRSNVDKWWTKDAFNLAWSYLRIGNARKGLKWMLNIFQKSTDKKYIDMSKYILRDIALFYAEANKINEAIEFFRKNNKDFTAQILKLSSKLSSTQSIKVLRIALKNEKRNTQKIEIQMALAEAYNKYYKVSSLELIISNLVRDQSLKRINEQQKERLIYLAEKNAAELQKKIVSKTFKKVPKTRIRYAKLSAAFFVHLVKLKPSKRDEYEYYKGESYYAIGRMSQAISSYQAAFDLALSSKNKRITKLSMEGMLACLGSRYLSVKNKNKNYIPVYERFLADNSKSKRGKDIYQKLFKVHFDDENIDKSINTLNSFKKSFPTNLIIQEAMIAQIMEYYRKRNNDAKIIEWITSIDNKKYRVSKKYRNRLRVLQTNIQMKNVEGVRNKGNKAAALEQYLEIFSNKNSTKTTKKNSAYNISVLFFELGDVQKVYEWSKKTIQMMSTAEVSKFTSSFVTFTSFLFEKMEFSKSAEISEILLTKICHQNKRQKQQLFTNAIFLRIAEGSLAQTEQNLKRYKSCGINRKIVSDVRFELADIYLKNKNWKMLEQEIIQISKNVKHRNKILWHINQLSESYKKLSDNKKVELYANKFNKYYYASKKRNQSIEVRVRTIMAKKSFAFISRYIVKMKKIKLSFPQKRYDQRLKYKLKILDQIVARGKKVINEGSDEYIVKSYLAMSGAYAFVSDEIRSFSPPVTKGKAFQVSFKNAMKEIYVAFSQQAIKFKASAKKDILKYSLVSSKNIEVLGDGKFNYQYFNSTSVLMEREGSKW